jgi:hypothetical protein
MSGVHPEAPFRNGNDLLSDARPSLYGVVRCTATEKIHLRLLGIVDRQAQLEVPSPLKPLIFPSQAPSGL